MRTQLTECELLEEHAEITEFLDSEPDGLLELTYRDVLWLLDRVRL